VYFATQYAFIGYSYMISWLYTRANMAYKTVFLLTFSCFTLVPVILIIIAQEEMIFWLCALISPIVGMMQAISVGSSFHVAAFDSRFAFIALLIVQGLACLLVCIYIDTRSLRAPDVGNMVVAQVNEEDVIAEANRVVGQGCTDSVKTQNLCKQYTNGFMAVKGTSFGIDKGQVFGLLGPNGAGKSTTFNMITSRLKPTNG
jgi:ATP-binding cassette subfamily A (ABC1) protein 3